MYQNKFINFAYGNERREELCCRYLEELTWKGLRRREIMLVVLFINKAVILVEIVLKSHTLGKNKRS